MRKKATYKIIGEKVVVECDDFGQVEHTCWEKFRELRKNNLPANAFTIKTVTILENGGCEAVFQPVQSDL